jgi:hypothetical protein
MQTLSVTIEPTNSEQIPIAPNIMITRPATPADISGILTLQSANLYSKLSEADRHAYGFVTTPFEPEQLQELINQAGAFVAEVDGTVVGYAFAASWDYFSQWPIFPYMVSRFPQIVPFQGQHITDQNSFQYGPVCVDRSQRGTCIFPALFKIMCDGMAERYPIGYTFINKKNLTSIAAHKKLQLQVMDEFEFNNNAFYGLAFPTQVTHSLIKSQG